MVEVYALFLCITRRIGLLGFVVLTQSTILYTMNIWILWISKLGNYILFKDIQSPTYIPAKDHF